MRIAILRCEKLPSFVTWEVPDKHKLFEDDILLKEGFESRGHSAESVVWSDPDTDWNEFDVAIIRSTWDYIDRQEEFLNVLSEIEDSACKLYNTFKAVQWNIDKHYLLDLEKWKVPIVPTHHVSETNVLSLQNFFTESNSGDVVFKPVLGAAGAGVYRVKAEVICDKYNSIISTNSRTKYLIQPLIESVITEGEWSFIFFGNELSHVVLKRAAVGDYRTNLLFGGTIELATASDEDVTQAKEILSMIPFDLLYSRLDLVRVSGKLAVIEIELIEPMLYFKLCPEAIDRLVDRLIGDWLIG